MNIDIRECKYFTPRMKTLLEYCKCLYKLEDCGAGGLLHILLDDDNYDTDDILFCLNLCITNPEREESDLGILICKEYLKLSMEERTLFDTIWCKRETIECPGYGRCDECEIMEDIEDAT